MSNQTTVEINEKYTIIYNDDGSKMMGYRNGTVWRELTGDNLILGLVAKIEELENRIELATNCLVCAAIGDAFEVCENTLEILTKWGARCGPCGVRVESGTEPDKETGEYWCPTCDQAGATPSC